MRLKLRNIRGEPEHAHKLIWLLQKLLQLKTQNRRSPEW